MVSRTVYVSSSSVTSSVQLSRSNRELQLLRVNAQTDLTMLLRRFPVCDGWQPTMPTSTTSISLQTTSFLLVPLAPMT